MKRLILFVLLAFTSIAIAFDKKGASEEQAKIAADLAALPIEKGQFILYSLDPRPIGGIPYALNTDNVFHGHTILGKAEINDPNDKRTLMKAFVKSVQESDGSVAMCFNPRHGIRLVIGSSTYDFVICFECLSAQSYGFNNDQEILITHTPGPLFNNFLDKYHLNRPTKNNVQQGAADQPPPADSLT